MDLLPLSLKDASRPLPLDTTKRLPPSATCVHGVSLASNSDRETKRRTWGISPLSCCGRFASRLKPQPSSPLHQRAVRLQLAPIGPATQCVSGACSTPSGLAGVIATDSPHPQAEVWFGLLNTNPEENLSTRKSISVTRRNSTAFGSMKRR